MPQSIVQPLRRWDPDRVGPYAIIGPRVTVSERCQIAAHAVLERNVKLGTAVKVGYGSVLQAVAKVEKTDVPAGVGGFEIEARVGFGFGPGVGLGCEERVVTRLEQERSQYDQLMRSLRELCSKGALLQEGIPQPIFIVGVANLVAGEADAEQLRQLLQLQQELNQPSTSNQPAQ